MEEKIYTGPIEVEITALALVRQRCILHLPHPMTQAEAEAYAEKTAGDRHWNYDGTQHGTFETNIVGGH